jgi:catechol 2,3-dioxygenase-like lactoylglutathione lyase family enzyme
MTITGIHHIGLTVRHLDHASTFLRTAMGFEPSSDASLQFPALIQAIVGPTASATSTFLRTPNCYLELLTFSPPHASQPIYRPVNHAGITHICVQSQSMDQLYGSVGDAGATFHAEPIGLGTGAVYCYARDPELNVIELECLPYAPPHQAPWVAHAALATTQIGCMADFYHTLLGGNRLGGQQIGPNPRFDQITALNAVEVIPTWIVSHNLSVELWQFINPPTIPAIEPQPLHALGYNHLCFEVIDLSATLAVCCAAGASQVTPVVMGHAAQATFIRDPDGNLIELLELLPAQAAYTLARLANPTVVAQVAALRPH